MLVVVTGGSGSGKSAFAEDRVLSFGESRRIYIATMQAFDEESHRRIRRHRRMRSGKGFETIERYTELDELILPKNCVVLLESSGGFRKDHRRSKKSSFTGRTRGDRYQRNFFRWNSL